MEVWFYSESKDIVEDELIVKRSAPGLPNVTFVDLPGLLAAPADLKERTEKLVRKYMVDSNMFVLVVPAANNLSPDAAYGLITNAGKASSTILVLSKTDIAAKDDTVWHDVVVPRLLGRDAEMNSKNFKACVATRCRSTNRVTGKESPLEKVDDEERAWAVDLIATKTDCSPAEKVQIGNNMTVRRCACVNFIAWSSICQAAQRASCADSDSSAKDGLILFGP